MPNEETYYSVNRCNGEEAMETLRGIFPNGRADELNFVLFSTSGVHGSYLTLEEIEASLRKDPEPDSDDPPDGWAGALTFLVIRPRIVNMVYGELEITLADIPYLKKLRKSSWEVVPGIGKESGHVAKMVNRVARRLSP